MAKGPSFRIRYTESRTEGDGPAEVLDRTQLLDRIREATAAVARGKVWWYRAPLLLPLVWILYRHLGAQDYSSIFGGLNLAIHEAGHLLFMWSRNDFLTVAGGTILQCICPVFAGFMFYRQKDFFAITVALFWLGTNLTHIAPYAADARAQLLPLVSPFPGAPGHDWNYLLGTLGLLQQDHMVGGAFRAVGILIMGASLSAGVWVLRIMAELAASESGSFPVEDRPAEHLAGEDGPYDRLAEPPGGGEEAAPRRGPDSGIGDDGASNA